MSAGFRTPVQRLQDRSEGSRGGAVRWWGGERRARGDIACVDAHNESFAYHAGRRNIQKVGCKCGGQEAKEGAYGSGGETQGAAPLMQLQRENVTIES